MAGGGFLLSVPHQEFISGIGIVAFRVFAVKHAAFDGLVALVFGDAAHAALGRQDRDLLRHAGRAVFAEEGDERLTRAESLNDFDRVEGRILAEGGSRRLDGFLLGGGVCAKAVLDFVAKLSKYAVGNVARVLRAEVNADAFRANQFDDLLDLVEERFRRAVEQQMRFVEEEDHLRLRHVADLGQRFEQLGQHPEQEGRVKFAVADQALAVEDVDHALAHVLRHPVVDVQSGFAEEYVAAGKLQSDDCALDRRKRRGAHLAVIRLEVAPVVLDIIDARLDVLRVDQEQIVVVGNLEDDVQKRALQVVQLQDAREEQRPDFRNGGAKRDAVLAENIPKRHGAALIAETGFREAEFRDTFLHVLTVCAGAEHSGDVALDVRHEHGNSHFAECLRHHFQRDGLAGAGGSGHESVTVRHLWQDKNIFSLIVLRNPNFTVL